MIWHLQLLGGAALKRAMAPLLALVTQDLIVMDCCS